jgi:hypothetical protein
MIALKLSLSRTVEDRPLVALMMITKVPSELLPIVIDTLRDLPPHPNIGLITIYSTDEPSSPSSGANDIDDDDAPNPPDEEADWKSVTLLTSDTNQPVI